MIGWLSDFLEEFDAALARAYDTVEDWLAPKEDE